MKLSFIFSGEDSLVIPPRVTVYAPSYFHFDDEVFPNKRQPKLVYH